MILRDTSVLVKSFICSSCLCRILWLILNCFFDCRHVRNNKGAVQVEEGSRWRGMTLRDPAHLDVHDPALTCLAAPTSRTTVNGYHGRIDDGISGGVSDSSFVSARTQGLRAIKRRRLVRAGAGLCASHRRGAGGGRIPAVQCKCVLPLTCVLCTRLQGIVPPTAPPDPDTQPWNERHARVDPTFHPVLSQPAGKYKMALGLFMMCVYE